MSKGNEIKELVDNLYLQEMEEEEEGAEDEEES